MSRHPLASIAFGAVSLALLSACTSLPPIEVRTWDTSTNVVYPERGEKPHRVPWLNESRTVGVVFSGGGTRAAAATLGQLRALDCLGWLPSVSHISAVSGGSWAAVPYTYLPPEIPDEQFLGTYAPPSALTDDAITKAPERSLTWAINGAYPIWRYLGQLLFRWRGDESFSAALGDIFLRPFGLGDRSKFFASHREALEATLRANPGVLSESDFLLPQYGRPFLVVGATLIGKTRGDRNDFYSTEITPLYSGMVGRFRDPSHPSRVFGGGFVESLAFDSKLPMPQPNDDLKTAKIASTRHRFTLSDVIGASGAAPQALLTRWTIDNIGLPEFKQWPIDASHRERETHYGDGGHVDNIGLMPLLGRQVPNILVFVNTATAFDDDLDPIEGKPLYGDLLYFFRDPKTKIEQGTGTDAQRAGAERAAVSPRDPSRVVIERGEDELKELFAHFKAAKAAGEPLMYCDKYDIKENARFGVRPYKASICWVYLDRTKKWVDALKDDADQNPALAKAVSGNFPHYATFFEHGDEVIRLPPPYVNALSNLTAWTVLTKGKTIADALGIRAQETNKCRAE